jgi:hypothetical protein
MYNFYASVTCESHERTVKGLCYSQSRSDYLSHVKLCIIDDYKASTKCMSIKHGMRSEHIEGPIK